MIHHLRNFLSTLDVPLLASLAVAAACAIWGFGSAMSGRPRQALVAACGLLLAHVALYLTFTVDDSFITFRYAHNWSAGLGPVYQLGERVEGFTSFLWTALLALAGRLGSDIERASKLLGVVCAVATLPALARLGRALRPEGRAGGLAPLLLGLSPLYAAWTPAGMDAPLFAMTLAWAAACYAEEARTPEKFPLSAVLFGLLVMVRPEGFLFAIVALASRWLDERHQSLWRAGWLRWGLLFAAVAVPYWLARWAYFGQFFPNTFYAKTGGGGAIILGAVLSADFLAETGALMVALVLAAALTADWRSRGERFVFVSVALFIVYVTMVNDILRLRFFVHFLPLWVAAAALGLDRVLGAFSLGRHARLARAGGPAAVLALAWVLVVYRQDGRVLERHEGVGGAYVVDVAQTLQVAHIPLGKWLREHAAPGSRVAAGEIGAVAYYSGLPTIDLWGLNDRTVAQLNYRRAPRGAIADYVLSRRPEFMVLYGTSKGPRLHWFETRAERLAALYRVHSFWQDSRDDKGLTLMVRNDLQIPPASPPGDRFRR